MSILLSISTVLFVILCILLIIIILLQSDKSAGMGILGGSSQSAFGSSTVDVITKITAIMVGLFMVGSLGLAVLQSQKSSSREKELLKTDETSKGLIKKTDEKDMKKKDVNKLNKSSKSEKTKTDKK